MIETTFRVDGLDNLERTLQGLSSSMTERVLEAALRSAVRPLVRDMRRKAPRGAGSQPGKQLADTIVVRTKVRRSQDRQRTERGFAEVFVGPTAPHAHLVEFGHDLWKATHVRSDGTRITAAEAHALRRRRGVARILGPSVTTTKRWIGTVPAHPFVRPAWDMHRGTIARRFGEALWSSFSRRQRQFVPLAPTLHQ